MLSQAKRQLGIDCKTVSGQGKLDKPGCSQPKRKLGHGTFWRPTHGQVEQSSKARGSAATGLLPQRQRHEGTLDNGIGIYGSGLKVLNNQTSSAGPGWNPCLTACLPC